MRLIDADALEKVLQKRSDELFDEHFPKMSGALMGVICYVISAPTIDAIPVVRCGECKLHGNCTFEETFITTKLTESRRYCGAGERKDGKENT